LSSAASLVGPGDPEALALRLVEAGARVVTLRMGAAGSLVVDGTTGRRRRIPAVPVRVVDPVGAGNAFCGGFLAGWVETGDLLEAGLRGAVAASFLLEQHGVPVVNDELKAEAMRRIESQRWVTGEG
jgi:sugar/nucleoside kinase (ribokinase family)